MTPYRAIIEAAADLAAALPSGTVESVATAILTTDPSNLRSEIGKRIAHHHHRSLVLGFLYQCLTTEVDPTVVAVALQSAAFIEQRHRDSQSVELVWTGPDAGDAPFRRTEQAILQVLDSAQERITLVSFAVYRIPNIADALVRAAKRGVCLTVIVETPDKLGGDNEYDTLRALGSEVEGCSAVYYWPKENRKQGDNQKVGLLHVKCAVADGRWLFLSSANLTQQAFTINMELGVLLRSGSLPSRIAEHFGKLIAHGVLIRV